MRNLRIGLKAFTGLAVLIVCLFVASQFKPKVPLAVGPTATAMAARPFEQIYPPPAMSYEFGFIR